MLTWVYTLQDIIDKTFSIILDETILVHRFTKCFAVLGRYYCMYTSRTLHISVNIKCTAYSYVIYTPIYRGSTLKLFFWVKIYTTVLHRSLLLVFVGCIRVNISVTCFMWRWTCSCLSQLLLSPPRWRPTAGSSRCRILWRQEHRRRWPQLPPRTPSSSLPGCADNQKKNPLCTVCVVYCVLLWLFEYVCISGLITEKLILRWVETAWH